MIEGVDLLSALEFGGDVPNNTWDSPTGVGGGCATLGRRLGGDEPEAL